MNQLKALQKAIKYLGGQRALANACGIKQQTISDWVRKFKRVPAQRVLQIEKACKGCVTRHQLRPDIYPLETEEKHHE